MNRTFNMQQILEARLSEATPLENPAVINAYNEGGPAACTDVLRRIANQVTRSFTPLRFEYLGHRGRVRAVIIKQPMPKGRYLGWLAVEHTGQFGPKLTFYAPITAINEETTDNLDTVIDLIQTQQYGKRQQSRIHVPGKVMLVEEVFQDPSLLDPDYLNPDRPTYIPTSTEFDFDDSEHVEPLEWIRHDE